MPPHSALPPRDRGAEIVGLVALTLGALLLIAAVRDDSGALTGFLVGVLRRLLGIGVFVVPVAMIFTGTLLLAGGQRFAVARPALGFGLAFWVFLALVHLRVPADRMMDFEQWPEYGGAFGALLAFVLRKCVGEIGGYIVLGALAFAAFLIATEGEPGEVLRNFLLRVLEGVEWLDAHLRPGARRPLPRRAPRPAAAAVPEEAPPPPPADLEPEADSPLAPTTARKKKPSTSRRKPSPADQLGLFPDRPQLPSHYSPMIKVLESPSPDDVRESKADSQANIQLVENTLASFRIEAKVTNVKHGPVVTRYEIQPAPGIRVNRITALADDLALALAAISIRVEAPVPGMSVIGIEVPNKRNTIVRLREIIELDEFINHPSKLAFAIGKDIAGKPMIGDLAKMPHLLIGGATNSGKSVCLNCIISSILSRAKPNEVKFSLIDPKRVELTLFQEIPHLFHPVVVDARDSIRALRGAIREMENRYKLFASRGVRNIQTFNQRVEDDSEKLYYIVIVIDEMADLMMQAAAEVERLICRLAQLARATGIHLVVATQRPSVNVITGIIKANISSRIAFSVASQMDSRVILDANGAERLLGSGDMLYHPIDYPKSVRLQGAYVDENEVNRIVEILQETDYSEPEFGLDLESIEDDDQPTGGKNGKSSDQDALFDDATALVRRRRQASASMLQREFEIGYPRAGRIIDQLEQAGIIGSQDGSKAREVLIGAFADGELTARSEGPHETIVEFDDDYAEELDEELVGTRAR